MTAARDPAARGVARAALLPCVAAFAVRVAAGLATSPPTVARGFDFYGFMAENVLAGRGLCWWFYEGFGLKFANRAPLYPLFLAAVMGPSGDAWPRAMIVAQAAVGAVAVLAAALLARRWGGDRAVAPALWLGALWPYSVVADTGMVEHVLFAPLCTLALASLLSAAAGPRGPGRAFGAGVLCGLAALARVTFVTSLPFLAVAAWRRLGAARTALVGAGVAAALALWVVRNHEVTGHWVIGTDGGRALLVGNHPATYRHYPALSIDEGEREIYRVMDRETVDGLRRMAGDEVGQDRRFREIAVATMLEDPGATAWRMVRRACAQWSVVYNPGPVSAAKLAVYAASIVLLFGAAAAAAATCARLRSDLPVVIALAASFTAVAMLFWGQPRYLAPLHGTAIAMAAAWLVRRPETAP